MRGASQNRRTQRTIITTAAIKRIKSAMADYIRGLKDRYCSTCGSWWTEQEAKQKNPLGTRCPRLDCGSKLRFGPRYRRGRAAVMRVKKRIE
jgi:hypothetical protein